MRLFGRLFSVAVFAAVLVSCNTTETLTPQADVGGGRGSTPVTQADTDRMAQSSRPETYNNASGGQSRAGPQSTLEAQAQALQSGNSVSPASSGPPPQWSGQGQPPIQAQQPQQQALGAQPQNLGAAAQQSAPMPATTSSDNTIRFLPIIGAPVQAVTSLSRQLGAQARAAGLTIRPSSDTTTQHILKGYFSAFADGGKVTIVYVWDVLDSSGARLHRMQGQESIAARGSDPWAAVPASTMEAIAGKTIQDYMSWRQSRG